MFIVIFKVLSWLVMCSSAWSPSINSIFSARSAMPSKEGVGAALTESVAQGAQLALETCQSQFRWDRWNCPAAAFSRRGRWPADRETGYVVAITTAGVVHQVTKNCSRGDLVHCGCVASVPQIKGEKNVWAGSHDHVAYGERVSRNVLDSGAKRALDTQAYIYLHNSQAGRYAVRASMRRQCRCHGVSGSCTTQTCWLALGPFEEVAARLKSKYDHAIRVAYDQGAGDIAVGNSASGSSSIKIPAAKTESLVYLSESPNYCAANNTTSWPGTKGRACSKRKAEDTTPSERKSCKNMCKGCGHRVRKERRERLYRCKCTFRWCCEVICETCSEHVEEHFCK